MNIEPLQDYVLVKILPDKKPGVLESVEEKQFKVKGEVVLTGPDAEMKLKKGDIIMFEDYGRIKIPEDDKLSIIKEKSIVAKYK